MNSSSTVMMDDACPPVDLKKIIFKGFFWVSATSVLLYAVQLLVKLYLARLLAPADFGSMAIALSLISFANLFHDLGLGHALIQRKTNVQNSFNTVFSFVLIFSFFFMILLLLLAKPIAGYFHEQRLVNLIILVSLSMPTATILIPYTAYVSKNLLFFKGFVSETSSIIIGNTVAVYLAYSGWGYLSLGIGYVTGTMSYALFLACMLSWRPSFSFSTTLLKDLLGYGKYLFFVHVATIVITQGDIFLIGKLLGSTSLGYYALAYTFATFPAINSAHIVSRVMFPAFAQLQSDRERLRHSFLKSLLLMNSIIYPIVFGTVLISPFIFTLFLGEKWIPAHLPLIILCVLALFRSSIAIPSFFLEATGHAKKDMYLTIFAIILFLIGVGPATYFFGIVGTAICMAFIYFLTFSCYLLSVSKIIQIPIRQVFKQFITPSIASLFMFLAGKFILSFKNQDSFFTLFFIILISAGLYASILFLLNKAVFIEIKSIFLSLFKKKS